MPKWLMDIGHVVTQSSNQSMRSWARLISNHLSGKQTQYEFIVSLLLLLTLYNMLTYNMYWYTCWPNDRNGFFLGNASRFNFTIKLLLRRSMTQYVGQAHCNVNPYGVARISFAPVQCFDVIDRSVLISFKCVESGRLWQAARPIIPCITWPD